MIQLTKQAYLHFVENQEKLDEFIREKKGISLEEWDGNIYYDHAHNIALQTEVSEFVNECRDTWKYWKDKPVDYGKLKDELVDIIHFAHLILNKKDRTRMNFNHETIHKAINRRVAELHDQHSNIELLDYIGVEPIITKIYALLLTIAHQTYGMTLEEIVEAYDNKNAENYKRQKTGW